MSEKVDSNKRQVIYNRAQRHIDAHSERGSAVNKYLGNILCRRPELTLAYRFSTRELKIN